MALANALTVATKTAGLAMMLVSFGGQTAGTKYSMQALKMFFLLRNEAASGAGRWPVRSRSAKTPGSFFQEEGTLSAQTSLQQCQAALPKEKACRNLALALKRRFKHGNAHRSDDTAACSTPMQLQGPGLHQVELCAVKLLRTGAEHTFFPDFDTFRGAWPIYFLRHSF
jgi:hypothetical protein